MKNALFIGIDIGTQGTKTVLCDISGNVVAEAFCPSRLIRENTATIYEDPEDIFASVISTISEVVRKSEKKSQSICAIGIDAQMAGIMGIDKDFSSTTPLDSWLDTRCADYTALIEEQASDAAIESSGGQIIHAHAPKILWWKNEKPEAYRKTEKFVQPNGYVSGRLCGLSATQAFMDYTFLHFNNFSDNKNCCFNDDLLSHFKVDKNKMPSIVSPETVIGTVKKEFAVKCGLPDGVKVIAGCGDTAASSLGAGITKTGLAYDVAGTASVFACCTDRFIPDTKHKTLLFSRSVCDGLYLPLSYISGGGLCLEWFSGISGLTLKELDLAAKNEKNTEAPIFIPHFSGRTFPLDNRVSGAFFNLDSTTGCGAMYKAIMKSIAFEYKSYYDILCNTGCINNDTVVIGVGGGAKSPIFSQIKSDVLGLQYITPAKTDSAPVASALLAAHATGYICESLQDIFYPQINSTTSYHPNAENHRHYKTEAQKYLHLLNAYGDYMCS